MAIVVAVVAAVHAFIAFRPGPETVGGSAASELALTTARTRMRRREQARELAASNPVLARELGVGRPDVPHDYDDGGTLDVAQNAQGVRVEAAYGRPVMTSMHAGYSLGAITGALIGGGFAWAGVGPLPSLAAAGLAGAAVDAIAGRWLLAGKHDAHAPGEPRQQREERPQGQQRDRQRDRRHVRRLIIALGVLAICGLAAEGAAGDWSAVYLRDNLGTSAGFAALGFAAFSVTMTAGRAVGDRLIARFGTVHLVRWCGLLAAAGLAGGLVGTNPYTAVAGFAVFGAGLSVVVPQVFAAGGRADPARPGSGLARVVGLGYAGMTAGPAVIGAAASRVGLHAALIIPVLLALWIAIGAQALAAPVETARPAGAEHASVRDNS